MKERPILFSAPMVRAILSGAKTQTRRVAKIDYDGDEDNDGWPMVCAKESGCLVRAVCPFGVPGDRLWVREAWAAFTSPDYWTGDCDEVDVSPHEMRTEFMHVDKKDVVYAADGKSMPQRWRPSIHMPRWASRITLEVTGVRVGRLQDISEADAKAEGARRFDVGSLPPSFMGGKGPGWSMDDPKDFGHTLGSPQMAFANLWININGADGAKSWAANPWVWVVEFRRMT